MGDIVIFLYWFWEEEVWRDLFTYFVFFFLGDFWIFLVIFWFRRGCVFEVFFFVFTVSVEFKNFKLNNKSYIMVNDIEIIDVYINNIE